MVSQPPVVKPTDIQFQQSANGSALQMLLNAQSDTQLDQNSSILASNAAVPGSEAERLGHSSGLRVAEKFGMYGRPKKAGTGTNSSQSKYKAAARALGRVGTQAQHGLNPILQGRTGSGAGGLRNRPLDGQKQSITGLSLASYQSTGQSQNKALQAKASLATPGYQHSQ
jgi:hypothetical protein